MGDDFPISLLPAIADVDVTLGLLFPVSKGDIRTYKVTGTQLLAIFGGSVSDISYIAVTLAQAHTLATASALITNRFYKISDPFGYHANDFIFARATTANTFGDTIYFKLVPDYQNTGGTIGGIWFAGISPLINKRYIWNGDVYLNTTGAASGAEPQLDNTNYTLSPTQGYVYEVLKINYDFANDWCAYAEDVRGNKVTFTFVDFGNIGYDVMGNFQWGRDEVFGSVINGANIQIPNLRSSWSFMEAVGYGAYMDCAGEPGTQYTGLRIFNSTLYGINLINGASLSSCVFKNSTIGDKTYDGVSIFGMELLNSSDVNAETINTITDRGKWQFKDGTEGDGLVWTSDSEGRGTWQPASAGVAGAANNCPAGDFDDTDGFISIYLGNEAGTLKFARVNDNSDDANNPIKFEKIQVGDYCGGNTGKWVHGYWSPQGDINNNGQRFKNAADPVDDQDFVTKLWATTNLGGSSSNQTNVRYVSPGGDNGTAVVGNQFKCYATPSTAVAASAPGDLVVIFPGTYVNTVTMSGGVNIFCHQNVNIRDSRAGQSMFSGVNVYGFGVFTLFNTAELFQPGGLTNVTFEFESITHSGTSQIFNLGSINSGNVNIKGRLITAGDASIVTFGGASAEFNYDVLNTTKTVNATGAFVFTDLSKCNVKTNLFTISTGVLMVTAKGEYVFDGDISGTGTITIGDSLSAYFLGSVESPGAGLTMSIGTNVAGEKTREVRFLKKCRGLAINVSADGYKLTLESFYHSSGNGINVTGASSVIIKHLGGYLNGAEITLNNTNATCEVYGVDADAQQIFYTILLGTLANYAHFIAASNQPVSISGGKLYNYGIIQNGLGGGTSLATVVINGSGEVFNMGRIINVGTGTCIELHNNGYVSLGGVLYSVTPATAGNDILCLGGPHSVRIQGGFTNVLTIDPNLTEFIQSSVRSNLVI